VHWVSPQKNTFVPTESEMTFEDFARLVLKEVGENWSRFKSIDLFKVFMQSDQLAMKKQFNTRATTGASDNTIEPTFDVLGRTVLALLYNVKLFLASTWTECM
jgi:hypothetical protein